MSLKNKSLSAIKSYKKYVLFGCLVFVFGFIYHFPFQSIAQKVLSEIEKNTGIQMQTQSISYAFPIGIKIKGLTVLNVPFGNLKRDFEFTTAKMTLSPSDLITYPFKKSLGATLAVNGKQVSGSVYVSQNIDSIRLIGKLKKVTVDEVFYVPNPMDPQGTLNINFKGFLSGTFNITSLTKPLQNGDLSFLEGPLKLKLSKTTLNGPIIGELFFDQIALDSDSKKKRMTIRSLSMDGPALSGKSSGNLEFRPSFLRSILKLDGQLQIGKEGQKLKTLISIAGIRMDKSGSGAFKLSGPINRLSLKSY